MVSSEPLLKVRDLSVSFGAGDSKTKPLASASLDVAVGEAVGLVGESGSGKTLTARSVIRLVPGHQVKIGGSVRFDGREMLQIPMSELQDIRGREIGFVSQDALIALNPMMRIGRQITETLERHGVAEGNAARRRSIELLAMTGIPNAPERVDNYPHQFSGGMLQRANIAMALSCNPKLLIADEPTTALDVTIQREIILLLQRLQRESNLALLLISHDLSLVEGVVDRLYVMYSGRLVEAGPVAEVFSRPRHPYTIGLLNCLPTLSAGPKQPPPPIPGQPPTPSNRPSGCCFHPRCAFAGPLCSENIPLLELLPGSSDHYVACLGKEKTA